MFEVFENKRRQPRSATPLIISIAGHTILAIAVIIVPLLYATDNLPRVPTMVSRLHSPTRRWRQAAIATGRSETS